jgi:hypothetical protein
MINYDIIAMGKSYFDEIFSKGEIINELFDIDPERTDIVGFPAINRRFLLIKSHGNKNAGAKLPGDETMSINKILTGLTGKVVKSEFSTEAINAFAAIEKSVSDGSMSEADAISLLNELDSALGDGSKVVKSVFDGWLEKSGISGDVVAEDVKADEPEAVDGGDVIEGELKDEPEADVEDVVVDAEEADGDVEEDAPEDGIEKSFKEAIRKQALELKATKEDLRKAQEGLNQLRIEKQRQDFVMKAGSELSYLGKSADALADVLMSLSKAGVPEDVFKSIYDLLKSSSEMIKASGFFNEFGTSAEADEDDDVDGSLMKKARDLVKQGKHETVEKAYVHLLREDPSVIEVGY